MSASTAQATKEQIFQIRKNASFNVVIKEELVKWATGDDSKTSLKDLSYDQAKKIIARQLNEKYGAKITDLSKPKPQKNWGAFDVKNTKHMAVLSLCRQAQKTTIVKGREVADLEWLSYFLQNKAPVKKPLNKQTPEELSKTIAAMEGVVRSIFR